MVGFHLITSPGHYSASIAPGFFPGDPDIEFLTGTISSADGVYQANTHQNGWTIHSGIFSTFDEMKASVQQSWTMVLDEGLPTERNYSMMLDIDDLDEVDVAPPVVSFPTRGETIQTLVPNFQFELQNPRPHILQLRTSAAGGSSTTLATKGVFPGTTNWTPEFSLQPNSGYVFSLRNDVYRPDMGFSVPLDSMDEPLAANWETYVSAAPETNVLFYTAVPEPNALIMLVIGGVALAMWNIRPRK